MPLQVAISFIGNLLMNTNNQRRMQMNSTSRPCSTRHEIIKTIPTLRLQLQTNFILRATLSGVPRGRPSVRVVVTTTAAPIYCVHSLSLCNTQTGGEFSSTENLAAKKSTQKSRQQHNDECNRRERWRWQPTLRKWLFLCAPTGPKRAGPLLLSSSSSSSNGADGGTKRKKLQAQYFRPEDAHRAKCNAAECQR